MCCALLLTSDDGGIDVILSVVVPVLNDFERACMILSMIFHVKWRFAGGPMMAQH